MYQKNFNFLFAKKKLQFIQLIQWILMYEGSKFQEF